MTPVRLLYRQSPVPYETINQGLRILEPSSNRLQDKGLYVCCVWKTHVTIKVLVADI